MRKIDAVIIAFFVGAICFMIPMIIFFIAISTRNDSDLDERCWLSSIPVFRLTFMIIFLIGASGFAIQMYKKFRVNYFYIFELDPNYKITHI